MWNVFIIIAIRIVSLRYDCALNLVSSSPLSKSLVYVTLEVIAGKDTGSRVLH